MKTEPEPYTALANRLALGVIGHYSTSFTLATRLLGSAVRTDVVNLYAVVRIADEIVDGAAASAGMETAEIRDMLNSYEDAVLSAPRRGFHPDPVLHAWAGTARRCQLDPDHMRAFFASMRSDLVPVAHDDNSLASYIYGSAEVIGLMCLDIFTAHRDNDGVGGAGSTDDQEWLKSGARALGSAFQKINFLRDIGPDTTVLHRAYLTEASGVALTEADKVRLLDECDAELDEGAARIPALPRTARAGVATATALYRDLTVRLRNTPADRLTGSDGQPPERISVPLPRKTMLAAKALREVIR